MASIALMSASSRMILCERNVPRPVPSIVEPDDLAPMHWKRPTSRHPPCALRHCDVLLCNSLYTLISIQSSENRQRRFHNPLDETAARVGEL